MMQTGTTNLVLSNAQRKEEGDLDEGGSSGNVVQDWGVGIENLPFCCGICQVTSTRDLYKLYTKYGARALEDLCGYVEIDVGPQAAMVFTFSQEEVTSQWSLLEALMDVPGAISGTFMKAPSGRNITMVTVPLYPVL